MPAIIIEVLLFLKLFLRMCCSSHMGTFDGKPGNKKNWENFFQSFSWIIDSSHFDCAMSISVVYFPNAVLSRD